VITVCRHELLDTLARDCPKTLSLCVEAVSLKALAKGALRRFRTSALAPVHDFTSKRQGIT
jgi:hypothetical protein